MMRASIDHFDAAVEHGGCVISAERSVILSLVKTTTESGDAATFYVTKPPIRRHHGVVLDPGTPETSLCRGSFGRRTAED
jgi:hypothetical protein